MNEESEIIYYTMAKDPVGSGDSGAIVLDNCKRAFLRSVYVGGTISIDGQEVAAQTTMTLESNYSATQNERITDIPRFLTFAGYNEGLRLYVTSNSPWLGRMAIYPKVIAFGFYGQPLVAGYTSIGEPNWNCIIGIEYIK